MPTKRKASETVSDGATAIASEAEEDVRTTAVEPEAEAQEDEEGEEVDASFEPIDKLTQYGINASDLKKVKEAGFCTCQSVVMYPKKSLVAIRGMSEAKVDKLIEAAGKILPHLGSSFITSAQLLEQRKTVVHVTTGCTELDKILGGGIETQAITEVHGEFRTGKTQLVMTLCVTSQLPRDMGGGNGKVAVVDTEGSFRAERLQNIAERFNVDKDTVLEQVVVARAFTVDQQQQALVNISAKMSEEPFRMLIVDSVMSNLRQEYCGRGELSERQQRLGQMLGGMRKLAEEFNIAVVCTNQVMSDPAGGVFASADPKKPVGGHVLAHSVTNRLHVRKGKGQERIVKIIDSPHLQEAEATYALAAGGVCDATD